MGWAVSSEITAKSAARVMIVLTLVLSPKELVAVRLVHLPSPVDPKILAPATARRFWLGVREAPYLQKSSTARTGVVEETRGAGLVFPVLVEYIVVPRRFFLCPPSRYSMLSAMVRNPGSRTVGSLLISSPPRAGWTCIIWY